MAARDFTNESLVNLLLRLKRSLGLRLRGRMLTFLLAFSPGSSKCLAIGVRPKIINSKGIFIGHGVSFGDLCRLECYYNDVYPMGKSAKIIIGENSSFGDFTHIGAINSIIIGKNLLCAGKVLIIDHDHGKCGADLKNYRSVHPSLRELISKGSIKIGDNVWIGESAVILAGSNIGDGSVIGANSVVRGYVPTMTVYKSELNIKKL